MCVVRSISAALRNIVLNTQGATIKNCFEYTEPPIFTVAAINSGL